MGGGGGGLLEKVTGCVNMKLYKNKNKIIIIKKMFLEHQIKVSFPQPDMKILIV